MTKKSNGNFTPKINLISANNNMPKNQFPRNGQLKSKKRVFKNNNRSQGRENSNKNNNKNQGPLHNINLIDLVFSVARVVILLDFTNIRNMNLFCRLT